MAPKLSELLIREGLISQAQLDEALKCQVLFGGRLGTTLVEMDMIKESDVLRCLSKQLERPFVSPEELMSVPPDIIALIPKEIAEVFKIVPVNLEKKRLTVAMMNPPDPTAIDKISFMTGYTIAPAVCTELRVLHALEHYYGINQDPRCISASEETGYRSKEAVPSDLPTLTAPVVKPQAQRTCGDWEFELYDALLPDQSDIDPYLIDMPSDGAEIPVVEESPLPPPTTAFHLEQMWPLSRNVFGSVLTEAGGRNEIAGSVADYVYQNADRVALFSVKGRMAAGWKALIRKKEVAGFENFRLTLDELSALRVVADTRSFYLGPILDTPGNQKLFAALGGGAPERALLVPLMMMGRIAMIFYLDGGKELAKDLEGLLNTADMAGLSFEILHFLSSSNSAQ